MGNKQPAAAGALGGDRGRERKREENEAELGVSFGPIPGAIVRFRTSGLTDPQNESLREPLRKDCLGPSGLGKGGPESAHIGGKVCSVH